MRFYASEITVSIAFLCISKGRDRVEIYFLGIILVYRIWISLFPKETHFAALGFPTIHDISNYVRLKKKCFTSEKILFLEECGNIVPFYSANNYGIDDAKN